MVVAVVVKVLLLGGAFAVVLTIAFLVVVLLCGGLFGASLLRES